MSERAEFEATVARWDRLAQTRPRLYRASVRAMGALGYGYLALTAGGLAMGWAWSLIKVPLLGLKAAPLVLGLEWALARALWVRVPEPSGRVLRREEVPRLFASLDRLRASVGAPAITRVMLTDELNAGALQTPRLGVLGWYTNHLILGLPLLCSLSVEQMEAVIAHEMGHLAGGHGAWAQRMYRTREVWGQVAAALDGRRSWGLRRFLSWYVPRFMACTFPLARQMEYEADRAAARATSAPATAAALSATAVLQASWHRHHNNADLVVRARRGDAIDEVAPCVSWVPPSDEDVRTRLPAVLSRPASAVDTHPSLTHRLSALGEPALWVRPAVGQDAASLLLADQKDILACSLDEAWRIDHREAWVRQANMARQGREKWALQEEARLREGSRESTTQALERIGLLRSWVVDGDARADVELEVLHAQNPSSPEVSLALGSRWLENSDEAVARRGENLLAPLAREPSRLAAQAALLLRDRCWAQARKEEADAWHARLEEHVKTQAARHTLRPDAPLVPLPDDVLPRCALRALLPPHPAIEAWYVAACPQPGGPPIPVVAFRVRRWTWFWRPGTTDALIRATLLGSLSTLVPSGEAFLVCLNGPFRRLRSRLEALPEARLL